MQLEDLKDKVLDQFYEAVLSLKNIEECYRFFNDLCTLNEVQLISQRLEIAKLLKEGFTYQRIEDEIGTSTATISKVKRSIIQGNNSYDFIFDRLENRES